MKKIFTFILAAMLAMPMLATVLLTESFEKTGDLSSQTILFINSTDSNWYCSTTTGTKMQVVDKINGVDANLTYPSYCPEAKENAVQITTQHLTEYHQFSTQTSGTIYVSALIKINSFPNTNKNYILALNPRESFSGGFGRLYAYKNSETGYMLGIAKGAEQSGYLNYTEEELKFGNTYLIIIKYDIIEGDKNDWVSLYINPISTSQPTIQCEKDRKTGGGADAGAYSKDDPKNGLGLIFLYQTNDSPRDMIIDEIRVFTDWSDISLPTGSDDPVAPTPTLSVTKSAIDFGKFVKGGTYEQTFKVTAENLKDDITIASDNTNAVLVSPATIAKDNADLAGDGVVVTASINPERQFTFSGVKITVASTDAESKVITAKGTEQVITYKDVASFASLLEETETDDVIYTYTGTAAKILGVDSELKQIILKDAAKSVKVQISDADWAANTYVEGMKVTKFVFTAEILLGGTQAICTPITLTFAAPNFTREMTSTNLATICLKGDVSNFAQLQEQATFYKILCKQEYEGEVYNLILEEVTTNMDAGKPYIFQPKEPCTLKFYYSAATDYAGSENGLIGTFTDMNINEGMFLVSNNMFCKAGTGCTLAANRAYINMSQVPAEEDAQPKVGMRQLSLQNADKKMPTELAKPMVSSQAQKFIVKGKLMFKKNNNFYNAQGQIIK